MNATTFLTEEEWKDNRRVEGARANSKKCTLLKKRLHLGGIKYVLFGSGREIIMDRQELETSLLACEMAQDTKRVTELLSHAETTFTWGEQPGLYETTLKISRVNNPEGEIRYRVEYNNGNVEGLCRLFS